MVTSTVLTLLVFALSVTANPAQPEKASRTLHISRRLNTTSLHKLLHHDQLRAKYLTNRANSGHHPRANEPLTDQAVSYVANVTVGTGYPPSVFSLTVDTGSSNTWVGASLSNPYVNSSTTSTATGQTVAVNYGSGSFSGTEYLDTVTLSTQLVIYNQSIGAASQSSGFQGLDGILGIGPQDLTVATLSPNTQATIPTLTDTLFAQGTISSDSIAISFNPTNALDTINGEISWGATDPSKYTGSITYSPLTSITPANQYWGVDMSATYGKHSIFSKTAGVVDTGTTLILISSDSYAKYKSATGGVDDANTGLIRFTAAQYAKLSNLTFNFAGKNFSLTPNAQTWPRSLNANIGGTSNFYYGIVGTSGVATGQGLAFICGYAFLERFYSVYDIGHKRIGLATTPYTTAVIN